MAIVAVRKGLSTEKIKNLTLSTQNTQESDLKYQKSPDPYPPTPSYSQISLY